MITKHGMVKITDESLSAAGFEFDCGGTLTMNHCQNDVIDWAIARLESERIAATEQEESDAK